MRAVIAMVVAATFSSTAAADTIGDTVERRALVSISNSLIPTGSTIPLAGDVNPSPVHKQGHQFQDVPLPGRSRHC